MPRGKKFPAEQIIGKLCEAEVELAPGKTMTEVVRKLGVTEQTYYRWKREYGGLRTDQAKRMKDPEKENARPKRLLADAELDKAILREAASGTLEPAKRRQAIEHVRETLGRDVLIERRACRVMGRSATRSVGRRVLPTTSRSS